MSRPLMMQLGLVCSSITLGIILLGCGEAENDKAVVSKTECYQNRTIPDPVERLTDPADYAIANWDWSYALYEDPYTCSTPCEVLNNFSMKCIPICESHGRCYLGSTGGSSLDFSFDSEILHVSDDWVYVRKWFPESSQNWIVRINKHTRRLENLHKHAVPMTFAHVTDAGLLVLINGSLSPNQLTWQSTAGKWSKMQLPLQFSNADVVYADEWLYSGGISPLADKDAESGIERLKPGDVSGSLVLSNARIATEVEKTVTPFDASLEKSAVEIISVENDVVWFRGTQFACAYQMNLPDDNLHCVALDADAGWAGGVSNGYLLMATVDPNAPFMLQSMDINGQILDVYQHGIRNPASPIPKCALHQGWAHCISPLSQDMVGFPLFMKREPELTFSKYLSRNCTAYNPNSCTNPLFRIQSSGDDWRSSLRHPIKRPKAVFHKNEMIMMVAVPVNHEGSVTFHLLSIPVPPHQCDPALKCANGGVCGADGYCTSL